MIIVCIFQGDVVSEQVFPGYDVCGVLRLPVPEESFLGNSQRH